MTRRNAFATLGYAVAVGVACGLASALFLWLLDLATELRGAHGWLLYTLPGIGFAMGQVLDRYGPAVRAGTSLVIQGARGEEGTRLPLRMGPMVLAGTVLTHLGGGSAGREGTAVQMGASLADAIVRGFKLDPEQRHALLLAGIAGGFGSVFGTPFAGAVFAFELLLWRARPFAALPALFAALVGDAVTRGIGIAHTPYPRVAPLSFDWLLLGKWTLVALCVALTCLLFIELTRVLKLALAHALAHVPTRMAATGITLIVATWLIGSHAYLGLGVPTIVRAFHDPALPGYAFLAKLSFTALTLSGGFLGGEVTPLFFVGATLGNALAAPLGLPLALSAGVCMSAVFGAAANAPLALSVMAIELMGPAVAPHVLLVSALAYCATGRRSIYGAQLPQ